MPLAARRPIVFVLTTAAVLAACTSVANAAGAEVGAQPTGTLQKEIIGFELTPIWLSQSGYADVGRVYGDGLHAAWGGSIRLGRYRWQHAYLIPIEAGYMSSGQRAFQHAEIEGGVIGGTDRRFEIGLGVGMGGVKAPSGTMQRGWMISIAARYLFLDRPTWTVGVGARYAIQVATPDFAFAGWYVGGGSVVLTALEFGFGAG